MEQSPASTHKPSFLIPKNIIPPISLVLFLLIFFPLFPELIKEWRDNPYYSHGFFIPLLSGYFIWTKRKDIGAVAYVPAAIGILIVACGSVMFLLSKLAYQFYVQCTAMVIVLFGLVLAHMGWRMIKITAFSIFYLILMIPLPQLAYETITFHMRLFSTGAAFSVLKLIGIPATREGNIINLPTAVLIVGNPCSGLRGLISFIVGSLTIGYLFQKSIVNRVILVIFSIFLAIFMNTLRLVVLGLVTYTFKLEKIPITLHDTEGLVVLIIGLAIMFWVSDLLAKKK